MFIGHFALALGANPDTKSVAWSAIAMWVLVAWAWWLDAHRESRLPAR